MAIAAADDRVLGHSVTYALIEIGESVRDARGRPAARPPASRRAALIAVDQMPGSELDRRGHRAAARVGRRADSGDRAGGLPDAHPSWGGALAPLFRRRLAAPATAAERDELQARLALFATDPAMQSLLGEHGRTPESRRPRARSTALGGMGPRREGQPEGAARRHGCQLLEQAVGDAER